MRPTGTICLDASGLSSPVSQSSREPPWEDDRAVHLVKRVLLVRAAPELSRAEARVRAELLVSLLEGHSLFRSGTVGKPSRRVDAELRRFVSWLILR
jgi:hypothetical protein